jgi:hypothetical protein
MNVHARGVHALSMKSGTIIKKKAPLHQRGFLYAIENYLFCFFGFQKLPVLRLLPSGLPIRSMAQRKPTVLIA